MEKTIECASCKKIFKLVGPGGPSREVEQGVICPFCGEVNVVTWPIADGWDIVSQEAKQ
jgi:phage FluMu protein Com